MPIKAVLFDMDGTIADTEKFHFKAFKETMKEELNLDITNEELAEYIGINYDEKLERILKRRNLHRNDSEQIVEKVRKKYFSLVKTGIELFPGTKDLLKELKKKSFAVGLVSAARRKAIDILLEVTKSEDLFDLILGGDEVEKRKPNPECYIKASKKLRIPVNECIVIEDSPVGVEAAKVAGMFCIAIPNKYIKNGDFSKADMIVGSMKEMSVETIRSLA